MAEAATSESAPPAAVEQDAHAEDATRTAKKDEEGAPAEAQDVRVEAADEPKPTASSPSARTTPEEHRRALRESVPKVAVLVPAEHTVASLGLQASLVVVMDAEVPFYGEPHRLIVLQWDGAGEPGEQAPPARRILDILEALSECGGVLASAPIWPLHDPDVSAAIVAMDIEELGRWPSPEEPDCCRRAAAKVLRLLHVTAPSQERVAAFELHFGPALECFFAWTSFYIRQSWPLVLYAILWLAVRPWSFRSTEFRWLLDVMSALVVIWAFWFAVCSTRKFSKPDHSVRCEVRKDELVWSSWKEHEESSTRRRRLLILLFGVVPLLILSVVVVLSVFILVVMLALRVRLLWSDCLRSRSEEHLCITAKHKRGFVGWLAEASCDILIALLFALFYGISSPLARWGAGLLNYKYKSDFILCTEMLHIGLAAMHKLGFVGTLAFFFVPQWTPPRSCTTEGAHGFCPCNDLAIGEGDFRCFQRRLPMETRLWVFEKLLMGPFVVAPLIEILMKVILPAFARWLTQRVRHTEECCRYCWLEPLRFVIRLCTLLFAYDGGHVKCLAFVLQGHPFDVPEELPERELAVSALEQFKAREFEVQVDLMELELSLLWNVFFFSVMPVGVIIQVLVKILDVNADVTKLLYVQRRPVPQDDKTIRREIIAYVWCVAVAAIPWTAGLSLITYNEKLYEWDPHGYGIFIGMCTWMFLTCAATAWTFTKLWRRFPRWPAFPALR